MKIWIKLAIIFVAVVLASIIAGYLWKSLFNASIPAFLSGLVGGLAALPTWEFLRGFDTKRPH